jgi:hypothetical protein
MATAIPTEENVPSAFANGAKVSRLRYANEDRAKYIPLNKLAVRISRVFKVLPFIVGFSVLILARGTYIKLLEFIPRGECR